MYPAPVFMDFPDKSVSVLLESYCRTYLDEILNIVVHKRFVILALSRVPMRQINFMIFILQRLMYLFDKDKCLSRNRVEQGIKTSSEW